MSKIKADANAVQSPLMPTGSETTVGIESTAEAKPSVSLKKKPAARVLNIPITAGHNAPTVYVTLTDLRRSFTEVQRVLAAGAQVVVLKRGIPVATLMAPDDLLRRAFANE